MRTPCLRLNFHWIPVFLTRSKRLSSVSYTHLDVYKRQENRISVERMRFNEQVKEYNTKIRQFPTVLVAKIMGFETRPYFEILPGVGEAPSVEF